MDEDNQPIFQDVEHQPAHESADIEQEDGYDETRHTRARADDAGTVNQQQPTWRPGDDAASPYLQYSGDVEANDTDTGTTGDTDDIAASRQ